MSYHKYLLSINSSLYVMVPLTTLNVGLLKIAIRRVRGSHWLAIRPASGHTAGHSVLVLKLLPYLLLRN